MPQAFRDQTADYYILKPYTKQDLISAAQRASLLRLRQKKRIYIETFGRFNVYVDDKFVLFKSRIAKEILALLVHKRGTALGNKEAFFTIWEDEPYDHQTSTAYRKGLRKLKDTLSNFGIEDILISSGKEHRLDITKFDCDYYDFLNHDPDAIRKYQGEYMLDYSWGEETAAYLTSIKDPVSYE
jgi:two-component SAPR family response regulator